MLLKSDQPAPATTVHDHARAQLITGMSYAAGAYVMWGIIPLFWKLLKHVPASEILLFRVLCTIIFAGILVLGMGRLTTVLAIVRDRKALLSLTLSALLIGGNWWLFIWAVNDGRILETSLGYFINPLMSILLGVTVLGEKLSHLQKIAVGIATLGVLNQTWALGVAPWVSLALAASFAVYGLVRKQVNVQSLDGLLVETTLMLPIALVYLFVLASDSQLHFVSDGPWTQFLLVLAGPMTAIPLMLFATAVRTVRLSTMGFMQYIAPTLTMLTAVFIYHEAFTAAHAVTFGLIWAALALVTFDMVRRERYSAA